LSDTSVDPAYSLNLVRFLLAADEDQNASNGIKLPAFAGAFNVNFNQSLLSFEADADGSLATALASIAQGRNLPSVQAAVTHFNQSLEILRPIIQPTWWAKQQRV